MSKSKKIKLLVTFEVSDENEWSDESWCKGIEDDLLELWNAGQYPDTDEPKVKIIKGRGI